MGNVFISYARNDQKLALELLEDLNSQGFPLWIDAKNLLPGQNWKAEIEKAILESDVFIACLSNNSVNKKGFVQAELKKALEVAETLPEGDIFIIPVKFEECNVPNSLSKYHWVNYFDQKEKEKLFKSIQTRIKTITDTEIERFIQILKQGVSQWNLWRSENPTIKPNLENADLRDLSLEKVNLSKAILRGTNFSNTDLSESDLSDSDLRGANLSETNLSNANLTSVVLDKAILIGTNVDNAIISRSSVYAVNVWDLSGNFKEQKELLITPQGETPIIVDDLKMAQFLHLMTQNASDQIRGLINALTIKSVLLLGRFSLPDRLEVLNLLRSKLRSYGFLPIVFDFDRPTDKDFTETIKTLAGLSYFIIADVTNPKSSPLEIQTTIPDYQVPFVPIIQEGEHPFAMMFNLQLKYSWVLPTVSYDSLETLEKALKPLIIDPAIEKHKEIRLIRARDPNAISNRVKDFLENGER